MPNYKTATSGEINYNGIVVKEISPTMKLNLRDKKPMTLISCQLSST